MLFLLFLAAASCVRAENPYFTLSTTRSFAPGEKPKLHLYARNESELEFRIYRVRDEEKFISGLSEMHSFGEMRNFGPVERIDEETLLERFHDWKQSIWSQIKQFFRTQLSRETRDALKLKQSSLAQQSHIVGVAQFAQVPLLNDSQLVARWRQQVPPTYIADNQVLPIDPLPGGMYLVEATDGHLKAYTLLFVSQAALVTRTTAGQLLAYVVDRKTGVPINGAQVVLSVEKQPTARQTTAEDGVAAFDAPAKQATDQTEQSEDASDRKLWVMARVGKDIALVAPWYSSFLRQAGDRYVGYTYTDRPVYRPGHTVHFRAVIRERQDNTLALPKLSTVHVTVTDDQQKTFFDKQLPVSPMGTVQGDVVLPDDASLGDYSITIGEGAETDNVGRGYFQVQEYRKPEYQIRVSAAHPRVLQGDSNQVTVEARYFFGEPVANAKVKVRVYQNRHYWWDEDEDSDFSAEESSNDIYAGDQTSEQEGRLDANGKLTVSVPTSFDEDRRYDRDYVIEAAVTDEAGREITGRYRFLATYGSFHVRVESLNYVVVQGQQASFRVTAMDYDGKPVETAVHLHLSQYNYRNEKEETPAGDADVTTGADGTAMVRLPVNVSGSIRVLAQATTPEKRQVQDRDWLWVSGGKEERWGEDETQQARIIADKKSYAPGDTAHLTLASEVSGVHALVTATGYTIQFRKTLSSDGRSVSFDLPITRDSQPNVVVDAVFLKDGKIYQAQKTLKVPPVQQQLQITVTPAASVFQPGQSAVYDVDARDSSGKPVVAELSFGVVDEALYSIYPYTNGDIVRRLYPDREVYPSIDSSLTYYF
ncbi:MAG: MG2 domain-containing protein, partial [Acidobacteriaceae bacterium]|nr:MG2 domain-containing protein [Acidobacteriaceae bacterium]